MLVRERQRQRERERDRQTDREREIPERVSSVRYGGTRQDGIRSISVPVYNESVRYGCTRDKTTSDPAFLCTTRVWGMNERAKTVSE